MKRTVGFAATAGAVAVTVSLVLAACGGNGGNGSSSTGQKDREEALLEFAQCMREHGVDFPDPVNGRFEFRTNRADAEEAQEAQEACRHILQDAAPQMSDEQRAELQDALLEFARCMREHGVEMPDPTFQKGGGVLQRMPAGAEDDPKFDEAQKACQPILDRLQSNETPGQGQDS